MALNHISKHTLVAILRGIDAESIEKVADIIMERGFKYIEVPLNSPEPYKTITKLVKHCPEDVFVGAGTVTELCQVQQLADIGASLVVSPHVDCDVIDATNNHGMCSIPGFFTMTEALQALDAGAMALKFFPAVNQQHLLRNMMSVLPQGTAVLPVGGIDTQTMRDFIDIDISGFGFGGSLYKPNYSLDEIAQRATEIQETYINYFKHEES